MNTALLMLMPRNILVTNEDEREGTTARQQIDDNIYDYFLDGGDEQIFIPSVLRDQDFSNLVIEIPLPW